MGTTRRTIQYRDPLHQFRELMPRRVRRVLLAGSRYDLFQLWEDGQLSEQILSEWIHHQLASTSWITHAASSKRALSVVEHRPVDLVLATPHLRDVDPIALGLEIQRRRPEVPVVPIAFDDRELARLQQRPEADRLHRPYLWQGDFKLLLGIVQAIEDRWNVTHDTQSVGVSVLLVIEDSVDYYSMYLPLLHHEITQQSESVLAEGTNLHHKIMRLRARPKILHCTTWEEALQCFRTYRPYLLGVLSDVRFPRRGVIDPSAGVEFARMVRSEDPDLPILLQTRDIELESMAEELKARILLKDSPTLLEDLRRFLREYLGFGPFLFRDDARNELARARDLRDFEDQLLTVPLPSIRRHAQKNHFSTWLRARTEFDLARRLRDIDAAEFPRDEDLRDFLRDSIRSFRQGRARGQITWFHPRLFDPQCSFARIGSGSLGGKARGLGFVRGQLARYGVANAFPDVRVHVPPGVVIATDVFDRFLAENRLLDFALQETDDAEIERRFVEAHLPEPVYEQLLHVLRAFDGPLAVRSSSLLEDSQRFSLTGVYQTHMVNNCGADVAVRVKQLMTAIKRVYASTYFRAVKDCFDASPYVLEEERMAVIVQRLTGRRHGDRFYPDFAGVARSHNAYPTPPMKAADGIARAALGLGETVVGGRKAVSFSPRFPRHPVQFNSPAEILENSQTSFFALDMREVGRDGDPKAAPRLLELPIDAALEDGRLRHIGSTWSPQDERICDGVGRDGVPVVTFASVLKHGTFPLAELLQALLDLGTRVMNLPVELEFACNLPDGDARAAREPGTRPAEFAVLQMRPFALHADACEVDLDAIPESDTFCRSRMVLGGGRFDDVHDILFVDKDELDRSKTREVAQVLGDLNSRLAKERRPYLLIGPGRFGSADPWLGIPVQWSQIARARAIVEAEFRDLPTAPSQGSHFFQNLAGSGVGYFSTHDTRLTGALDLAWLRAQPVREARGPVRWISLERPITILIDPARGHGAILKPRPAGT